MAEKVGSYSIFKFAALRDFLEKKNIQKLSLCGIDSDACVLASAYDGFDLGYDIVILHDLCGSHLGKNFDHYARQIIQKNLEA